MNMVDNTKNFSYFNMIFHFVTKVAKIIHFHYKTLKRFIPNWRYDTFYNCESMEAIPLVSRTRYWKGLDYEYEMENWSPQ